MLLLNKCGNLWVMNYTWGICIINLSRCETHPWTFLIFPVQILICLIHQLWMCPNTLIIKAAIWLTFINSLPYLLIKYALVHTSISRNPFYCFFLLEFSVKTELLTNDSFCICLSGTSLQVNSKIVLSKTTSKIRQTEISNDLGESGEKVMRRRRKRRAVMSGSLTLGAWPWDSINCIVHWCNEALCGYWYDRTKGQGAVRTAIHTFHTICFSHRIHHINGSPFSDSSWLPAYPWGGERERIYCRGCKRKGEGEDTKTFRGKIRMVGYTCACWKKWAGAGQCWKGQGSSSDDFFFYQDWIRSSYLFLYGKFIIGQYVAILTDGPMEEVENGRMIFP